MFRRIKELREDNDFSQEKLADILGVSQTGYSKYEIGKREIPTQILIKLADFYGTSVDYLLGRTNERASVEELRRRLEKK